jgi:hypothetical protein
MRSKSSRAESLRHFRFIVWLSIACLAACVDEGPPSGTVKDEALQVGRMASSFPAADEDYFKDMDGALPLNHDQVVGRDNWIVWSGGNDRLWDILATKSVGSLDFLKTLSSAPGLPANRANRWERLGLVNEPCFVQATGPDPEHFGLWLDQRKSGPDCPADPFANETKYPGVAIGARGKTVPVGSFYGWPTGVVGLRLFPNPAFDEAAKKKWDPVRYYTDASYYEDKDLVRPYRVGMACGFCHVGPNPIKPPADPANPTWANLSSNVGAQYFWVDRIFAWNPDLTSFVEQVFHTARPGSLDTSLISTDNINNPRTMNAIYDLPARLRLAQWYGVEKVAGGSANNKQFNDFVPSSDPLAKLFQAPDTAFAPHVLKDGADSVGALGALNRVYLNIGLFSEEWLTHFNALIGGKPVTPIEITVNRKNSSYWNATEMQTPAVAAFFLATTAPHHLKDAPGGSAYLSEGDDVVAHGKDVFAERCARCHSSKMPTPPPGANPGVCAGAGYLDCWDKYWAWTQTDEFKTQMRRIVEDKDFLKDNFLSTDMRVPVTLLQTNACSPLATNGLAGNIWDNFTSQSYKELPSVGAITIYDPLTGEPSQVTLPGGGRGFTRVPSLISVWSTAPFLLNNSVGKFNSSPSVDARMASFQDSIEQLLWPERRDKDSLLGDKIPGTIDRTTTQSYLRVPKGYLPDKLEGLDGTLARVFPWLINDKGVEIGPFPKGMPIDLLTNLDLVPKDLTPTERAKHDADILGLLIDLKSALKKLPKDATDEQARAVLDPLVPKLLAFSNCKDFVVNRGHYFGTDRFRNAPLSDADRQAKIEFQREPALSDADKRALIAFIKNF